MPILTQQQLKDGIQCFYNYEPQPKRVVEVGEYAGEKELNINCTQLEGYKYPQYAKARERKRVLSEWCEFLTENPEAFTVLSFGTRMPQELFNAVCRQKNLKSLYIKWGVYPDISAIAELQNLEYLWLTPRKEVNAIYNRLLELPKLKYGLLFEHPELYR